MVVYGGVTTAGGDYVDEGVVVAAASSSGDAAGSGVIATMMPYNEEEDGDRMAVDEEDSSSSDCHGRGFFCSTPMQAALQHTSSPLRFPSSPLSLSSPCSLFSFSSSPSSSGVSPRCSTPFGGAAEDGFMEDTSLCLPLSPPGLDLHAAILEAVALEPKYQPSLSLTTIPTSVHEVSGRMRSGSCHVLRCLKVWYELPSDAFFLAVNTMDRFLTRMRAQPKHLSCIAVSSFHVACEELSRSGCCGAAPTRDSVSSISQSKCTAGDVARMEGIIRAKLELGCAPVLPVTPLTMLRLLHAGHRELLSQHFSRLSLRLPTLTPLVHKLEVVVCDTRAANYRAAELALALLRRELLRGDGDEAHHHAACLQPLTTLCKVNRESLASCEQVVSMVLDEYDSNGDGVDHGTALYHRQRLVWKLSNRTLRHLRPTDRLRRHRRLPTIIETCRDSCSYVSPAAWARLAAFPLKRVDDCTTGNSACSKQNTACLQEIDECSDSNGVTEEMDCYSEAAAESDSSDSDNEDGEHECTSSSVEGDGPENDSGVCVDVGDDLSEERDEEESRDERMETSDADDAGLALSEAEEQEDGLTCGDRSAGAAASMCCEDASGDSGGSVSYSQVAKKMKEESSDSKSSRPSSSRSQTAATPPLHSFITPPSFSPVQTSPLSKITLTPALSHRTSSAVKNLRQLLEDETMDARDGYYYGYSRRRVVLGIESIDGEVMEHWGAIGRSCLPLGSSKGGKRKKTRGLKLQLVTHPSYDGSDSDMPSENTSSEEEMDSDYEKDFPPLPLPRISLQQRRDGPAFRKKTSSTPIKKKKKSSDASPYAVKTKVMRNMHAKKMAAPM